jgi:hypothetical protein
VPAIAPAAPGAAAASAQPASPFTGSPGDAQVFAGVRARREMLVEQLERASERRGELAGQLSNTPHSEQAVRRGLEDRLGVIDERVVQLERDIVATDRQLAGAPPMLLAETQEPPHRVPNGPDEDDLLGMGFGGFLLGVVVMLVGARIRRWRQRGDRGAARPGAAGVAADPRLDRLAHAVDAIAVEVERIGEGQRFVTQLLAEPRGRVPELAAADAVPTQSVPGTPR